VANLLQPSSKFADSLECDRTDGALDLDDWSIDGESLPADNVAVGNLRTVESNLSGIIGADNLAQFGIVRIDYDRQLLTLGTRRTQTASRPGSTDAGSVPAAARRGTNTVIPMRVVTATEPHLGTTTVRGYVPVTIGRSKVRFVLDTGATIPVIGVKLPDATPAPNAKPIKAVLGLGCTVESTPVVASNWKVGSAPLPAETFYYQDIGHGVDGLLGSGALQHLSPIVVDYLDGALLVHR
jgi:hypothetical protein